MTATIDKSGRRPRLSWKRALPLIVLLAGTAAFFISGSHRYVTFDTLARYHDILAAQVDRYGVFANAVFLLAYAVMAALSLPGGALMSILGGFLFGWFWGGVTIVVGATLGATAVFLAAKTALGDVLAARARGRIAALERGFRRNAFSYLLTLRLIPVVPFWLLNLAPALLGVKARDYVLATAIGIIPGTFVYASVGNGLGAIIARGERPDLGIIFSAEILLPLLALAVLSLLPALYRTFKGHPPETVEGEGE